MNRYISVIDEKTQLKKPTVMIHITNDLSITARKIIGIFLKNAYDDIMQDTWHSIKVSDLIAFLGEKSYKPSHLKKVLNELQTTLVQWNIMGKDQKPIEFMNGGTSFSLVAGIKYQSASVEAGFIQYYFAKPLVEELFIPTRIYAKINLWIQQRFTNKHAMAIWEYLIEVICTTTRNEKTIVTSWIEIKHLRLLLGLKDDEYKTFADVNKHIIKKAVLEINKVSEIEVDFDLRRNSRKVDAVRFFITKKDDWNKYHSRDTGDLSGAKNPYNVEQKTLISIENDTDKQELLNKMVNDFDVGESVAKRILSQYTKEEIQNAISFTNSYKNAIRKASVFMNAIKNGLGSKETQKDLKKRSDEDKIKELRLKEWNRLQRWINFKCQSEELLRYFFDINYCAWTDFSMQLYDEGLPKIIHFSFGFNTKWQAPLKIGQINSEKIVIYSFDESTKTHFEDVYLQNKFRIACDEFLGFQQKIEVLIFDE